LQRQWMLMEDREAKLPEFMDQAMHICALSKRPRTERSMHLEGSIQHERRYTVLFQPSLAERCVRCVVAVHEH
jgi:hypothetical protein